jgi:hypothetical protein
MIRQLSVSDVTWIHQRLAEFGTARLGSVELLPTYIKQRDNLSIPATFNLTDGVYEP